MIRRYPDLEIENLGPITKATLTLGALTVLVGPQASGKSILLQTFKLMKDLPGIKHEFKRAGVDWGDDFALFLDVYFGDGMRSLHTAETRISTPKTPQLSPDIQKLVDQLKPTRMKSTFYVPAQRVLTLRNGWPQAFNYFDSEVPFAVREFSEAIRLQLSDYQPDAPLFPMHKQMKQEFRDLLGKHVFRGFNLNIDQKRAQKRLVLTGQAENVPLPYMVWSAGQREFVPLLLAFYHLMTPAGASRRKGVEYVIVEEPEMGLHPRAISVVMLMIFELMARGYKVLLSTHSPQILEAVWALRQLQASKASPEALLRVFGAPDTPGMNQLAKGVLMRWSRVYYFDKASGQTEDISNLDPSSEKLAESGWGGLAEFSSRANEEVARAVANKGRQGKS